MQIIEVKILKILFLLLINIMIKYKLICNDCEIKFDSWFASSKEYEKLKKKKF
jgi:hypothetical protein